MQVNIMGLLWKVLQNLITLIVGLILIGVFENFKDRG